MIRSTEPPRSKVTDRADWYDYVARVDLPTIAVLQDIDGRVGYGAYWGEVQSTIHKALGSIGCVTNGSFRDLDMWAPGYQMIGGRIGLPPLDRGSPRPAFTGLAAKAGAC